MHVIMNLTTGAIASKEPLSLAKARIELARLRAEYVGSKFIIYYLMVVGE